jgi:nicotinamide mononucleotide transporter
VSAVFWLTAVAALVGVVLNIHRHVACFWIWAATNAVWVYADIAHGIYPQAALQAVYFALSVYGIWKWSSRAPRRGGATCAGP